jgi:dephospho-CoA kinase
LTGGIGCGKSTASNYFARLGWNIVDADRICADLYNARDCRLLVPLEKRWGEDFLFLKNGYINKSGIANRVFEDKKELQFLESVILPLIYKTLSDNIQTAQKNGTSRICLDIPTLFENKWEVLCDTVITIWSPKEIVFERLLSRGLTHNSIRQRMKNQLDNDEKLERADYGIINDGDISHLQKQCDILVQCL